MTSGRYNIRAYWESGGRPLVETAQQLAECLRRLAQADEAFARLFEPPRLFGDAYKREVPAQAAAVERLLVRGGLSYRAPGPNLTLTAAPRPGGETCSVEADEGSLVLKFPQGNPTSERLFRSREALVGVIGVLVDALEPRRVQVDAFRHSRAEGDLGRPRSAGWITYLPVPPESLPPLPGVVWTQRLSSGSLVVLSEEPPKESDPLQSAMLESLSEELQGEGLL